MDEGIISYLTPFKFIFHPYFGSVLKEALMKPWIWSMALVASCFSLVSCSSNPAPSIPSGLTFSYNSPEILAAIVMQGGTANVASVELMTDTQAVTNATVTLTGPSLSLPLTFTSSSGASNYYYSYYNSVTGWNYLGNTSYTMTISYGGHTFTSTITSVGTVVFSPSSSGITISWSGGGNENTATAFGGTTYYSYTYGPNITSPYTIAKSGLAAYSAGNYHINMNADETRTSAFSGAYAGSSFTSSDQESTTY